MVSLVVTRHTLVLGAVDAVTGIPTLGYVDSLINMQMEPISAEQTVTDVGFNVQEKYRAFTGEALAVGDRIETTIGNLYAVLTCLPHNIGNIIDHYTSTLSLIYPSPSGGSGDTWLLEIIVMPIGYGVTSPSGVVAVAAGSSLQVTAAVVGTSTFTGWIFDGASVGSTNPYTVAAQTAGSTHILIAVFNRVSVGIAVAEGIPLIPLLINRVELGGDLTRVIPVSLINRVETGEVTVASISTVVSIAIT